MSFDKIKSGPETAVYSINMDYYPPSSVHK